MSTKAIVWVHGDMLSPINPALTEYPGAPAIFVWDDALLERWKISLKRVVFMYECLLEMPVIIRRGSVADELIAFAREYDASLIVTVDSPSPDFELICQKLEAVYPVEIIEPDRLVDYDGEIDLRRFSRYWQVAQKYAFG